MCKICQKQFVTKKKEIRGKCISKAGHIVSQNDFVDLKNLVSQKSERKVPYGLKKWPQCALWWPPIVLQGPWQGPPSAKFKKNPCSRCQLEPQYWKLLFHPDHQSPFNFAFSSMSKHISNIPTQNVNFYSNPKCKCEFLLQLKMKM